MGIGKLVNIKISVKASPEAEAQRIFDVFEDLDKTKSAVRSHKNYIVHLATTNEIVRAEILFGVDNEENDVAVIQAFEETEIGENIVEEYQKAINGAWTAVGF